MIISLWINFLSNILSFEPFIYILAAIVGCCAVLLIRSLKVW